VNGPGTYVALLRGVNVGGARRVAMADLRELVESLGHQRVRTYIQSGNVIFSTDGDGAGLAETALALGIRGRIADRLGLDVDVMVRSRRDLEAILVRVPFKDADPKRVVIAFLSEAPTEVAVRALESIGAAPESVRVIDRVAYLNLPNGVGRSILAPQLERRLEVRATARNLATARTLLAMCAEDTGA
jgi:uncharacterized protein (DUF1697 family)